MGLIQGPGRLFLQKQILKYKGALCAAVTPVLIEILMSGTEWAFGVVKCGLFSLFRMTCLGTGSMII